MNTAFLLDLAAAVARNEINYSGVGGVPTDLVARVRSALEVSEDTALGATRLILLAMAAQKAIDGGVLLGDDDFDDCA